MGAVGYNSLTNNLSQILPVNGTLNLGHIVAASCAQNISTLSGQTLTVNNTGTYNISVQVVGIATASVLSTLSININGVPRASVSRLIGVAPTDSIYEVRGIFYVNEGDVITVTNTGVAVLTLTAPTAVNGYNVSTIIERYS